MRILLAVLPLIITAMLVALSDPRDFSLVTVVPVFLFGLLIGTVAHTYWLLVLLHEHEFYKRFYEQNVLKPTKFDKELNLKHTKISLPFYLFGFLVFIIVVFVFGIFGVNQNYLLPLVLGAFDGVPLSYYLMHKRMFSRIWA